MSELNPEQREKLTIAVQALPPTPGVSKALLALRWGITETMIEGYMKRHWEKGRHYVITGGRAVFIVEECDRWWVSGQQESGPEGEDSKSGSGRAESSSIRRRSNATHSTQLPKPPQLSTASTN